MSLAANQRLGPYEIQSLLGKGGMGEVHKARDTRLDRTVAIKILKLKSQESRERFKREARTISSLNHPFICGIYDVGEQDGVDYLVLEYIEGTTLATRLKGAPLPLSEALKIGAQISEALEAAHRAGIVHRDLKPGNIMLAKSGVKLLDFGLAKVSSVFGATATDESPTMTTALTSDGTVLGTIQYMAPEQLEGKDADFRSDIFSLGSVLYEMVSARRAFEATSQAGIIAAILERDPLVLPPAVPPYLARLILACLEKDPDKRWQSAGDLRRALQWVETGSMPVVGQAPSVASARPWLLWLAATVALVAAATFATIRLRPTPEAPVLSSLSYSGQDNSPSASPDGKTIAFVSDRDGKRRIWLKELSRGDELALTDGPNDIDPRFSPDGSAILFRRGSSLFRVPAIGGASRKLVDNVANGADWSPDGKHIVFVRAENGGSVAYIAGATGDNPRPIIKETRVLADPRWSADGDSLAFKIAATVSASVPTSILVVPIKGGTAREVASPAGGYGISTLAWLGKDDLLYAQALSITGGGAIQAGRSRLVKQDIGSGKSKVLMLLPQATETVDIIANGTLVLDSFSARQNLIERPISGTDAQDALAPVMQGTAQDRQPVYSPDGDWLLFTSNRSGNADLWKLNTKTGELRRLTDDPAHDWDPAFSPDGKQIVWSSNRSGSLEIWTADAEGAGARQVSHDGVDAENPGMTADGWVVYVSGNPKKRGIWKVRLDGSQAMLVTDGSCTFPELSPDRKYLVFRRHGVLRALTMADGNLLPFEISDGRSTRWTSDGARLVFLAPAPPGPPRLSFQPFIPGQDTRGLRKVIASIDPLLLVESFGVSPDGTRVVVSARGLSRNLMLAERLPDVVRPARKN